MRYLKHLVLMVLASMFLVACGGGGGDGGGNSGTSTGGTNLKVAYDKVTPGMNYEQVKALVGYAHNNGESSSKSLMMYNWINGSSLFIAVFDTPSGQVKQITHTNGTSYSKKDF